MNVLMSTAVIEKNNVITQDQINEINSKFADLKSQYEALGELTENQKGVLVTLSKLCVKFCYNKQKYYEYINDNGESIKVDIYEEFNRKYQNNMDNLPTKDQIDEVSEKWNYIKDNYRVFNDSIMNVSIRILKNIYNSLCLNKKLCSYSSFNLVYDDFISEYDTKLRLSISNNGNFWFIIGPNFNGNIADDSVIPIVEKGSRDIEETVDEDGAIDEYDKSYMYYLKNDRRCTLMILNYNYRLTNEMLKGLSVLKICNISILSDFKEIPKKLWIEVLVKHTDKLSDFPLLQDYLAKCCNDAIGSYLGIYKLKVIVFCDENQMDEFQKNNQYDIGYNFVDVDGNRNSGYREKHQRQIDELVQSYEEQLENILNKCDYFVYIDDIKRVINHISRDLYKITSNKFLNKQIIDYYKEVMDLCISIVNQKLYDSTLIIKEIDLNALLKDFVSPEKISDDINRLIYALDNHIYHILDKLYKEKLKNLFCFNNISSKDIAYNIDLLMNNISLNLYKVISNKFSSGSIENCYKQVMDICISIVEKSFYSNINIVIKDIDLNALLKDFVSVEIIEEIQSQINSLKNTLSKILIIDVEGEFSLPESYKKSVYVINPKAVLTNKRVYVDNYFDYNTSVFSDKGSRCIQENPEPTKSCCSKLFISNYDNIKNSVCDWVYIDYDNTDLIKIIESRKSKVVDIIYQKDESEERKCELFIDICKRLKAVRDLPRVFAPTGFKHQSISIKNQMHWKIFAVCSFVLLFVIGFYYFNVNWSLLNAVVTYGIIVILFVVSMLIVYLIGRFDASHYYFYRAIYHIMSPFAEWDFNTFMVVCRDNNGLSIVAIAIIFIILFLLLFYLGYDSLLKFIESFDNKEALNDSVNNNLIHEQVHSVNISSVSIIDENNLDKSNVGEFVVHPIVHKEAGSSVNLDMLSESNVNEPKAIVDEDDVVDSPSNPSGDRIDMDSKSTINANNLINQMSIS